jgi:hypothetical protein
MAPPQTAREDPAFRSKHRGSEAKGVGGHHREARSPARLAPLNQEGSRGRDADVCPRTSGY